MKNALNEERKNLVITSNFKHFNKLKRYIGSWVYTSAYLVFERVCTAEKFGFFDNLTTCYILENSEEIKEMNETGDATLIDAVENDYRNYICHELTKYFNEHVNKYTSFVDFMVCRHADGGFDLVGIFKTEGDGEFMIEQPKSRFCVEL